MPSITDNGQYPEFTTPGNATNPFSNIFINPDFDTQQMTLVVSLSPNGDSSLTNSDLGTISDPSVPSIPASSYFVEAVNAADLASPSNVIQRLVYTPPANLTSGQSAEVKPTIDLYGASPYYPYQPYPYYPYYYYYAASDTKPIIDTVTAPAITGTVSNQPTDGTVFGGTTVIDNDFNQTASDTATIIITDGSSTTPTDADGSLSNPGVLSKTGVGTYELTAASPSDLTARLRGLVFSETPTSSLAPGQTITSHIELDVTDTKASLTSKDTTTSLVSETKPPVAPTISGTVAGQTSIKPFAGVTLTDPNFNAVDTLKVTVEDSSGTPTDANGTFALGQNVTQTGRGEYTILPTNGTMASETVLRMNGYPATLTGLLDGMVFQPSGVNDTTKFVINFADTTYSLSAIDDKTTIVTPASDEHRPPVASDKFQLMQMSGGDPNTVLDSWSTNGQPYPADGPVQGLTDEIILATSKNINVSPTIPNVFIHSGSGDDSINVTGAKGNNVLDGSTGSNFLVGGTGTDEFYVDDRNPSANIWTTVQNMHGGDKATIWGITQDDFNQMTMGNDVLPIAPGLDFSLREQGKPDVNLTLSDYHTSDLPQSMGGNGRLGISFGTVENNNYMQIHANS